MLVALFEGAYERATNTGVLGDVVRVVQVIPPTSKHFYSIPGKLATIVDISSNDFTAIGDIVWAGFVGVGELKSNLQLLRVERLHGVDIDSKELAELVYVVSDLPGESSSGSLLSSLFNTFLYRPLALHQALWTRG